MNIKRGLVRVWIVLAIAWVAAVGFTNSNRIANYFRVYADHTNDRVVMNLAASACGEMNFGEVSPCMAQIWGDCRAKALVDARDLTMWTASVPLTLLALPAKDK